MSDKPNLLIFENLVEPISDAIKELNEILSNYQSDIKPAPYIHKGTFAYVMALFEGAIGECVERYLFAFPEKLPKTKIDFEKAKAELLNADFSYDFMAHVIREYLTDGSYENSSTLIERYCQILGVTNLEPLFNKKLREKKARRNSLIHNNLKVDNKYIQTASADPRNKGKFMKISPDYVVETIIDILEIFEKMQTELHELYGSYTILKAVQDVWTYLFDSAMMNFDDYWGINSAGDSLYIKSETVKKNYNNLSSSERTLLFYILQNYGPGTCEKIFKLRDLNMQISNNHDMIFLVSVFDRFPLLLQSLRSIQPSSHFKYVSD